MLNVGGEIHITHKTAYDPFSDWKIEKLAKYERLVLVGKKRIFFVCGVTQVIVRKEVMAGAQCDIVT